MLAPFYFSSFEDGFLLTNDAGNYCFLEKDQFRQLMSGTMDRDSELWHDLTDRGMCFDGTAENYVRSFSNPVRDGNSYLFSSTSLFIFAVTNVCNNRCVYCQANGINKACNMSTEVAEAALQKISRSPSAAITIEFQGGEPLANFSVIKYIVERGEEVLREKDTQFTIVSNLSLLTDEIVCFIRDHHISVSTSLDGPQSLHDLNRPMLDGMGSYQSVIRGCQLLREHGIAPGAIQTTTAASISHPKEVVDEYVRLGFSQIFLRPLTRLGAAARCWDQIGYSASDFLRFYREAFQIILQYNRQGVKLTEYHASVFLKKICLG